MEVNNRGGKLYGSLNLSTGGNNPTTADHAGEAFVMNRGYSLAWNGWDPPRRPAGTGSPSRSVPKATRRGGAASRDRRTSTSSSTTRRQPRARSRIRRPRSTSRERGSPWRHRAGHRGRDPATVGASTRPAPPLASPGAPSRRAPSTSSATPQGTRSSRGWGSPRRATSSPS